MAEGCSLEHGGVEAGPGFEAPELGVVGAGIVGLARVKDRDQAKGG